LRGIGKNLLLLPHPCPLSLRRGGVENIKNLLLYSPLLKERGKLRIYPELGCGCY